MALDGRSRSYKDGELGFFLSDKSVSAFTTYITGGIARPVRVQLTYPRGRLTDTTYVYFYVCK